MKRNEGKKQTEANVDVTFWHASEKPHGTDADMGVAHAKLGFPVAVLIKRGNNGQSLHLSLDEVRSLVKQFAPLCKLQDEVQPVVYGWQS